MSRRYADMNSFRLLFAFVPVFVSLPAWPAALTWSIPAGDRLEITRTARVELLLNGKAGRTYEERNIIDLTCIEAREGASRVKGVFTVYRRGSEQDVFSREEQYPAEFWIGPEGRFAVPKGSYMPNLRHLPSFPGRDVAAGDRWIADAEMVFANFSVPFKLTFPVEYRLVKMTRQGESDVAEIRFSFFITRDLAPGSNPPDFPVKILGKDEGTLLWDVTTGRPVSMTERYRIIFFFRTGSQPLATNEFRMNIDTSYRMFRPVTREQKEEFKRALEKEMPPGIDVDTDLRGLVLRLGDVHFDFDSAGLRPESRAALDRIAALLKERHPDREIMVEGHTDVTGGSDYNMRLSRDRAGAVARYLKKRTPNDRLSYRGFGADRPIAGNDTKEGRQRNRRVEIIIKLQ